MIKLLIIPNWRLVQRYRVRKVWKSDRSMSMELFRAVFVIKINVILNWTMYDVE